MPAGRQRVMDHGQQRKYWTQVPNLLDDSDLSPYARTVYLHYLRISGRQETCEETIRDTADHCRMSRSSVANARAELVRQGWIEVEDLGSHGRGSDQVIHLLDRWDENMARYGKSARSENVIVHMVDNSAEPEASGRADGIVQPVDIPAGPVDIPAGPVDIPAGPVDKTNSSPFLQKNGKTGEDEEFFPPPTPLPERGRGRRMDGVRSRDRPLGRYGHNPPSQGSLVWNSPEDLALLEGVT